MCFHDDTTELQNLVVAESDNSNKSVTKLDLPFLLKVGKMFTYPRNLDMLVSLGAYRKYFVQRVPTSSISYAIGANGPPCYLTRVPAYRFLSFTCNYLAKLTTVNATLLALSRKGQTTSLLPLQNTQWQPIFGLNHVSRLVLGPDCISILVTSGVPKTPQFRFRDYKPPPVLRSLLTRRALQGHPIFSPVSVRIRLGLLMVRYVKYLLENDLFPDPEDIVVE
jgi:hypothetical protein